ncbi:FMN-dependent NADH-azoreductase [Photobacterium ganghwense]|uniref:FMN-dependent NADH-azoreductase n=1 Tax=Photobacterium ganghwense TaxID=320778 RepID=UPI001A8E7623|nr:NAD(P)H-dependent oxidoreductase [Photobacterium ganghwense]QSV13505.1 NAD(P)H-dependent oxidoreductase [Photobacterium ganghwense]
MTSLLHIDSSVRAATNENPGHNSISKNIAIQFTEAWRKVHNINQYIYRDVGMHPPEFINQNWIGAVFTPEERQTEIQRALLELSDKLIQEVAQADIIVISSPMYNYGMPAHLKAWFDQIIRINKTFDFDLSRGDFPLKPLFSGKTLVIITSSGEFGFEKGGIREEHGHLVPHLRTLSKYLGVDTIYEIAAEYQEFGDKRHTKSLNDAMEKARKLGQELANKVGSPFRE